MNTTNAKQRHIKKILIAGVVLIVSAISYFTYAQYVKNQPLPVGGMGIEELQDQLQKTTDEESKTNCETNFLDSNTELVYTNQTWNIQLSVPYNEEWVVDSEKVNLVDEYKEGVSFGQPYKVENPFGSCSKARKYYLKRVEKQSVASLKNNEKYVDSVVLQIGDLAAIQYKDSEMLMNPSIQFEGNDYNFVLAGKTAKFTDLTNIIESITFISN